MDDPQGKIKMPASQENSANFVVPGIAICGLITAGIMSTLFSIIGFLFGFLTADRHQDLAGSLWMTAAIFMAIAAGSFAFLLHVSFRR